MKKKLFLVILGTRYPDIPDRRHPGSLHKDCYGNGKNRSKTICLQRRRGYLGR